MKTYYVYILKCSDGSYYTDFTSNLDAKIEVHQSGKRSDLYTFQRGPVQLVFSAEFNVPMFAIAAKKQIGRWSKAKKEALINGEFNFSVHS
ncbi:GIY-YIG nuclease family protein [Ulvibacter antarcticus]|uniref:Putative endonuclease n=1 Tax=Ulvibacter antarcticus TaxID=442714 RepID=A0A3L9YH48_9FLAO|nr:GIY-YIG nuclease family protein [Ulvibacter antarcticus]RMA58887.1 putative endonuclease [Ulvibacter antarcticus]